MIFYGVFTKVGSAIQGWINGNYDALTPVKPRVYHKYLKDSDKANLYPTKEAEGEDPGTDVPATLGALTVASAAGSASGTTSISVTEAIASGNVYKYKLGDAAETVTVDQDLTAWTDWDGTADITVTTETTITIAE